MFVDCTHLLIIYLIIVRLCFVDLITLSSPGGKKRVEKQITKFLLFTAETYYLNIKHLMKYGDKGQCSKSSTKQRKWAHKM